jgi:hypothetical protein
MHRQEGQEVLRAGRDPKQRVASYREGESSEKRKLDFVFATDALDVSGTPPNLSPPAGRPAREPCRMSSPRCPAL